MIWTLQVTVFDYSLKACEYIQLFKLTESLLETGDDRGY